MTIESARAIAADYGDSIMELNDPKRLVTTKTQMTSLPREHLRHSKEDIQTALAITIADLVVSGGLGLSRENQEMVDAAVFSSGDLAYFTRIPCSGFCYEDIRTASQRIFSAWRDDCISNWKRIHESQKTGVSTKQPIDRFWKALDAYVPTFLQHPTLVAIRET